MKQRLGYYSIILCVATACGNSQSGNADGSPDLLDGGPTSDSAGGSCAEFGSPAATLSSYPASYDGDTAGAGANLQVGSGVCDVELDDEYVSNKGEDQVIQLSNLTPSTVYAVSITSVADLSFYVATDCTEAAGGPANGQCLVFGDRTIRGTELGHFTAPASGTVMLVVDQRSEEPADDASYTLEVWEAECLREDQCSEPTPLCYEYSCVECIHEFDCGDGAAPICSDGACAAGYDQCTGDDDSENGNDGPAGAIELNPSPGSPDTVSGAICSMPADEADYFKITVPEGAERGFILDWPGDADLDIVLKDANGNGLVAGFNNHPEAIRARDLAAGTYYVYIHQYRPEATAAAVAYTLTAVIPECENSFGCEALANPVCNGAGLCSPGFSACTGLDSASENGDDGPAGANTISVAVGGSVDVSAGICNNPGGERDYHLVNVSNGDNLTITLAVTNGISDLNLHAYSSDGALLGFSWWNLPEVVTLTHLPPGHVYLEVSLFSESTVTETIAYTLTVDRSAGGCLNATDCAAEYETQLYRGTCSSGACHFIDGGGALGQGVACDSDDDCSSGICSYVYYESDADLSVCSIACSTSIECTNALGDGYACTTPYLTDFCHPACTTNTDCGADIDDSILDVGLPWHYLTCTEGTGGVCGS